MLECLLRASCLFSLPDALMEQATTLLLTLLFVPRFKRKFGKALVRHYDAVARFPETLPWPGVVLRSLASPEFPEDARVSALEFSEAAHVAASGNSPPEPSRALTAYASRRARRRAGAWTESPCSSSARRRFWAAPATRDALLRAVVATLERCVVGRHPMNDPRTDERTGKTPTNAYRSPLASFDPADEAARHRLFARPCNDLRMLLSRRDAARRWLYGGARSPFFRSAIKTLAALAGMHAYRHKKGEHVLRESRAWIEAVTAETFVCSTFRAGVACVGDGLAGDKRAPPGRASSQNENENENASGTRFEDVTALLDARDALLDACADWHAGFVRHELRDETGSLRSNERLLSDLHASPVSMHVPLHRLWAVAAHWAAAARASLKKGGENKDTENKSVCFADAETCRRIRQQAVHPLRALAFAEQVTHGSGCATARKSDAPPACTRRGTRRGSAATPISGSRRWHSSRSWRRTNRGGHFSYTKHSRWTSCGSSWRWARRAPSRPRAKTPRRFRFRSRTTVYYEASRRTIEFRPRQTISSFVERQTIASLRTTLQ